MTTIVDEWFFVPRGVLSEALRVALNGMGELGFEDRFIPVTQKLLDTLLELVTENVDGCDHSVGICQCSDVEALRWLATAAKEHGMECPFCDPDFGALYRSACNATCERMREEGFDCNPECHLVTCPCCLGRTWIPLPRAEDVNNACIADMHSEWITKMFVDVVETGAFDGLRRYSE